MYIVKKGENVPMPLIRDKADAELVIGPDKRVPRQRFKVMSGSGGFYVYDYKKYDVVKDPEGKYYTAPSSSEAWRFVATLPQANLTMKYGEKEVIVYE